MHITRLIFGLIAILSLAALGGQWISPVPFPSAAALGRNGVDTQLKFGRSVDIDNVEETVWQTTSMGSGTGPARYADNQTAAYTLWISGSAGNDAMTITVHGLDASWDFQSVDVVLGTPSTTAVKVGTDNNWLRTYRAFNTSSSAITGILYLQKDSTVTAGVPDDIPNDLITILTSDYDQTMMVGWTVPDGKAYLMKSFCYSNLGVGGSDPVTFNLRAAGEGTTSRVQLQMIAAAGADNCVLLDPPRMFTARTDLEITAKSTGVGSNQTVSAHFNGEIHPN